MPLINCKINLILTWSANCVIPEGDTVTTFAMIETKFYVPVVTLWTQDNTKYCNIWNQNSNAQLTGINTDQK